MGTFNPLTNAHIDMALRARKTVPGADIFFIPDSFSFMSSWKTVEQNEVFNNAIRHKLLDTILAEYSFNVSYIEDEGLVSGKTYDTVTYFKDTYGYSDVYICMGTDKLPELERWYKIDSLLSENQVLLFDRDNESFHSLQVDFLLPYKERFIEIDGPFEYKTVSSTQIREAFHSGYLNDIKAYVPKEVFDYLTKRRKEMSYPSFDAKTEKERIINWIREWFKENGPEAKAVLGISGGKDSSIASALCVEALGKERVVGVMMPNGEQADIDDSKEVCSHLEITNYTINIKDTCDALVSALMKEGISPTAQTLQNIPPRVRMTTLYAVSQSVNGRVINTCNRSEDYVGYSTKYGDSAGDLSPLGAYTVDEVLAIGDLCNIPAHLVHKAPSDGLCGKTDEDNLGFTYKMLDHYIKTGECEDTIIKEKIDKRHIANLHKLKPVPTIER